MKKKAPVITITPPDEYAVRRGKLGLSLTRMEDVSAEFYVLDLTEYDNSCEGVDNDCSASPVPLDAEEASILKYLETGFKALEKAFSKQRSVKACNAIVSSATSNIKFKKAGSDHAYEWTFNVTRMVEQKAFITVKGETLEHALSNLDKARNDPDIDWGTGRSAFYREPTLEATTSPNGVEGANAEADKDAWFDVRLYETKEVYDNGNFEDIDGFTYEKDAVEVADLADYSDYYQVEVVAQGQDNKYEPGEVIYSRFERAD